MESELCVYTRVHAPHTHNFEGHTLVGVKTGELVHTSKNQVGSGENRGKFYDKTTTPECSEDRTAVPSV